MTYGLLGRRLDYSFSRRYFTDKFERERLPHRYLNFELPSLEGLPQVLRKHENLHGLNVTIPYKREIFAYLDRVDEVAEAVGAVNTIGFGAEGLTGFNTDVIGVRHTLGELLGLGLPSHVYVLGTGGAAQAVCYVLDELQLVHTLVSRTPAKDQLSYQQLDAEVAPGALLVNTTPVGTYPGVDEMPPVSPSALRRCAFVFDLVYNPAQTLLLRKAAAYGCRTINGLPMLIGQAEASWHIWQAA